MLRFAVLFAFAWCVATPAAHAVVFTAAPDPISVFNGFPPAVAIDDIDADGDPDLVVTTGNPPGYTTFRGGEDGRLTEVRPDPGDGTSGSGGTDIALGDVDEDGRDDLVTIGIDILGTATASHIAVARGFGDGTFGPAERLDTTGNLRAMALGDTDADGHLDVVVTDVSQNAVRTFRGDGTGTLSEAPARTTGTQPFDVAVDGTDVITADYGDGTVSVLHPDGTRAAVPLAGPPLTVAPGAGGIVVGTEAGAQVVRDGRAAPIVHVARGPAVVADFDGDGRTDVLAASNRLVMVRGGVTPDPSQPDTSAAAVFAGDVDGDGDPDVITTQYNGGVSLYYNGPAPGERVMPCPGGTSASVTCLAVPGGMAPPAGACLTPDAKTYARLILGTAGAETITGSGDRDLILTQDGHDRVDAGEGADCVISRDAAQRIHGGAGADTLVGGTGGDRLHGDGGDDDLRGLPGADRLFGEPGDDNLSGGLGPDRLVGGPGTDTLFGGHGNDRSEP